MGMPIPDLGISGNSNAEHEQKHGDEVDAPNLVVCTKLGVGFAECNH